MTTPESMTTPSEGYFRGWTVMHVLWSLVPVAMVLGCQGPDPAPVARQTSEALLPPAAPQLQLSVPRSSWELLYALPESCPDKWFSSIWASETEQIVAVGNVLVTGTVGKQFKHESSPFDTILLDVWGPTLDRIYAVGAQGAIVRFDGVGWGVDREKVDGPRGRDQLLHSVGPFLGIGSVVAFGPDALLVRGTGGGWVELGGSDADLVRRRWGGFGFDASPCANATQGWFADRAGTNWVRCDDGHAYVLTDKGAQDRGLSPSSCERVGKSAIWRGALYTSCGGKMWRNEGEFWTHEAAPSDIRQFAPTQYCLYAISARQILRKCSTQGTHGRNP